MSAAEGAWEGETSAPHLVAKEAAAERSVLLLGHPIETLELEGEKLLREAGGLYRLLDDGDGDVGEVAPGVDQLGVVAAQRKLDLLEL